MLQRRCPWFGLLSAFALTVVLACPATAEGDDLSKAIRSWRLANEHAIVAELADLVAQPNLASDSAAIERNVAHLLPMLERRGFTTRVLRAGNARPAVYAERKVPGAERTVTVYSHYDGQPVDPERWSSDPWTPELRSPRGEVIDLGSSSTPLDPEARLYGRSASDDKGPIVAVLAAIDALQETGFQPSVNLKIFLEGEEEVGSPYLRELLATHRDLLESDVWILADGPVHPSRRQQVIFGVRGVTGVELTLYGPARPLHSGHYGNWAPNPAAALAHLVSGLRAPDGTVTIAGFYDDVRPLSDAELEAARAMPAVETELMRDLALATTEGEGAPLQELIMRPALNVKGLASAQVGSRARNAIPVEAKASIGIRLVPDQTPESVREKFESHLSGLGYTVVHTPPDLELRSKQPNLVLLEWNRGYAGARTAIDLPISKAILEVVDEAIGEKAIRVPSLGGSVPVALFVEALDVPVVIVPMVNHDNNQHAADENLRLADLWRGIEVYAHLIAKLGLALD